MTLTRSPCNAVVELHLSRRGEAGYHYSVMHAGEVLFEDGGFTSVSSAVAAAAAECTDFAGLQVAYEGVVAGTYTASELQGGHEAIAALCVERRAVFAGD